MTVRLSALRASPTFTPRKIPGTHYFYQTTQRHISHDRHRRENLKFSSTCFSVHSDFELSVTLTGLSSPLTATLKQFLMPWLVLAPRSKLGTSYSSEQFLLVGVNKMFCFFDVPRSKAVTTASEHEYHNVNTIFCNVFMKNFILISVLLKAWPWEY
jgi:hypothetical protein